MESYESSVSDSEVIIRQCCQAQKTARTRNVRSAPGACHEVDCLGCVPGEDDLLRLKKGLQGSMRVKQQRSRLLCVRVRASQLVPKWRYSHKVETPAAISGLHCS